MVGAPGPANSGPGVVAAEEGRSQVEDVPVDQSGGVEVVGHRGASLHQHLHDPPRAEFVEDLARGPDELERRQTAAPSGTEPSTTRSGCSSGPR